MYELVGGRGRETVRQQSWQLYLICFGDENVSVCLYEIWISDSTSIVLAGRKRVSGREESCRFSRKSKSRLDHYSHDNGALKEMWSVDNVAGPIG